MNKSQSWPETVPETFARHDSIADAYRRGWNHAHGIACHNVPTIGETYRTDDMGKIECDAENIRDVHASLCYAAESNARCFSPWEFTAAEFNAAGYDGDGQEREEGAPVSEDLWEAYEAGVSDSIAADLATYDDEAYGIEPDPWEIENLPEPFATILAPSAWASYLINGDACGLADGETEKADAWCAREGVRIIDVRRYRNGEPVESEYSSWVGLHAPEAGYAAGELTIYVCEPIEGGGQ